MNWWHGAAQILSGKIEPMPEPSISVETELQKMYNSEIHVDIGWLRDGGIDVSIGSDGVSGHVRTVLLNKLIDCNRLSVLMAHENIDECRVAETGF
jgi:hypothetical protein